MSQVHQGALPLLFRGGAEPNYSAEGKHQDRTSLLVGRMRVQRPAAVPPGPEPPVAGVVEPVRELLELLQDEPAAIAALGACVARLNRIQAAKSALRDVTPDQRSAAVQDRLRALAGES